MFFRLFRSPFHMALEGLAIGVAIAVAERAGGVRPDRRTGAAVLATATAAFAAVLAGHDMMADISLFDLAVQPLLVAGLAGAMVLGAAMLSGTPMPGAGPAGALARLSYTLYLVHFPLIPAALAVSGGAALPFWTAYLVFSTAAAIILHVAVERPFLRLKARLEAMPAATAGPAAVAV
jgi:peptidoglycan/LPS O-acetylase OafA/YrhL